MDLKFDDMSNTLREEGSGSRRGGGGEIAGFCSCGKKQEDNSEEQSRA